MDSTMRFYQNFDVAEYTFETIEELKKFIDMYKDDKHERYYYGDISCFDGELYSLEDLSYDVCEDWFSNDKLVHIYEF